MLLAKNRDEERDTLLNSLPIVRGKYRENYAIGPTTWFQVGGPCEVFYRPEDIEDLKEFLRQKSTQIPLTVVGMASNMLIRDGGIPGVTMRLGKGFNHIAFHGDYLDLGAAVLDSTVAALCMEEGIENLSFLCGIPGAIGGALRMNAGCYGTEIKDVLDAAFALDSKGVLHTLTPEDMGYSYRHCQIPRDWVFVGARFKVVRGRKESIQENIQNLMAKREESQPVRSRTGGSTFANPKEISAWEAIDKAGCRGLTIGGAQMSPLHCNFMINIGGATANDLETLGETVRHRVKESSNIDLRWEIERVGHGEPLEIKKVHLCHSS